MIPKPPAAVLPFVFCAMAAVWLTPASAQSQNAPVAQAFSKSERIADRYIVVFKDSVGNPAAEAANAVQAAGGGQILHTYTAAIKGFAATLPAAAVQALRNNPNVDYIEQDQTVALSQVQTWQSPATWGLDRIDQQGAALNNTYFYTYTGLGVKAYIVDTGIRPDHLDFASRLLPGFSSVSDANGTNDCNGHGTHVAGTVGGTTWGVAKQVTLIPVRVLNCRGSGSWSGVIAGIDWVAANRVLPAVANMSLGGGLSTAVNAAVAGAVARGVTMVVAAGNSNANACSYSPASEPTAITVGATTTTDARASYSNYGTCLDVFAPGSGITSAWHTANNATNTISGTSMASPHVAGAAALAAQANPTASPAAIASFLATTATAGPVTSPGTGSPNLLLYSLGTGAATEPPIRVVGVTQIEGSASLSGSGPKAKNWQAKAKVTVADIGGATVGNATVNGSFAPGNSGSCITSSDGTCTIGSGNLSLANVPMTTFTVTGVSGPYMSPGTNAAAQITINKP